MIWKDSCRLQVYILFSCFRASSYALIRVSLSWQSSDASWINRKIICLSIFSSGRHMGCETNHRLTFLYLQTFPDRIHISLHSHTQSYQNFCGPTLNGSNTCEREVLIFCYFFEQCRIVFFATGIWQFSESDVDIFLFSPNSCRSKFVSSVIGWGQIAASATHFTLQLGG